MDDQIVIGLTGPFGAGCSTISDDLVARLRWRKYSLTEAMRKLAPSSIDNLDQDKLISPKFRAYQQDVGDQIRKKDIYAIPKMVAHEIQEDQERDRSLQSLDIVIDGIRNPSEMVYFRDRFPHFFVIAAFASVDIRWARKEKAYEGSQWSFRRDDERDSGEFEAVWGQKVQLCVDRSDILISNEEQFLEPHIREELQRKIDSYIQLMKTPGSRGPHTEELNMVQAYEASLTSSCSKRRVGAVVVKEELGERRSRSYIIATGYNEAPLNVRPCSERGEINKPAYCYKDERVKRLLKEQYKFCPKCGAKLKFPKEFNLPLSCPNSDCGARLGSDFIPGRMLDLCIAIHAEESAILQAVKFGGTQVDGSILYTTTFPCSLCAKMIVHTGIQKVVFAEPYPQDEAIDVLAEAGVPAELFEGVKGRAYHRLFEARPYKPERR